MSFFIGLIFFCSLKIKVWAKQVAIPLNWPAKLAIKCGTAKYLLPPRLLQIKQAIANLRKVFEKFAFL